MVIYVCISVQFMLNISITSILINNYTQNITLPIIFNITLNFNINNIN
jgi:hypothetical protein